MVLELLLVYLRDLHLNEEGDEFQDAIFTISDMCGIPHEEVLKKYEEICSAPSLKTSTG